VLDQSCRLVSRTTIAVFIVCGAVGSSVGTSINDRIDRRALQRRFAIFLVAMAGFIAAKESMSLFATAADPPAVVEEVEP
jgi:uncharacterized membrane protein YfcA